MDALRKAEEAKKQAEQQRTIAESSPKAELTAEAVAETPELPEVEIEKPSSQDLSVKLEFEEDLKPAANVSMKPSLS